MITIPRRHFLFSLGAATFAARAWARIGNVKIGVCRRPQFLNDTVRFGFDYLEPPAAEIAEMDESSFRVFRDAVLASPIRCECFNSFDRKLRVVGDDVPQSELDAYVEST